MGHLVAYHTIVEHLLTRSSEEKLAISATVLASVLDVDVLETLTDGTSGLISSKNTLASSNDGIL